MIDFEVGEIPTRALGLEVKDQYDNTISTAGYSRVELEMRGSDDEKVDLTGVSVQSVAQGFAVSFPVDRSLFTKKGKYLIRLALYKPNGSVDYTRPSEIRVRDFGRI